MFEDYHGDGPRHWHPDHDYWAGSGDTELPKKSQPAPKQAKPPSRWRAAAKEILACVGYAAVVGLPLYAAADWWYHKDIGKPHHGGQVRMTEQNHVELVVKPDRLVVYVTDHEGRPSDLRDTIISAAVGNGSVAKDMQPTGGNSMELRGRYSALSADTMVMVKVDKNCEQPNMAVFTPMTPEPPLPVGLICTVPKPRPATCRQAATP